MLPVINFDTYCGKSFSRKWLSNLPEDIIVRQRDKGHGVCRYMVASGGNSIFTCAFEAAEKPPLP